MTCTCIRLSCSKRVKRERRTRTCARSGVWELLPEIVIGMQMKKIVGKMDASAATFLERSKKRNTLQVKQGVACGEIVEGSCSSRRAREAIADREPGIHTELVKIGLIQAGSACMFRALRNIQFRLHITGGSAEAEQHHKKQEPFTHGAKIRHAPVLRQEKLISWVTAWS